MSSGATRKPPGRPRAKTPAVAAAALLEQRRVADRTRQAAHNLRITAGGGRVIGPIQLDAAQARALERIMARDGAGIADTVRAALVAYAAGGKAKAIRGVS